MATCPYTWVRSALGFGDRPTRAGEPAQHLVVRVVRDGDERMRVALPARGARRLLDLIPEDVLARIRDEEIPIDAMVEELRTEATLMPRRIFDLRDDHREVAVWLE